MHKTLLSVSLWMLPMGCSVFLDLTDVQIVDGGSANSTDANITGANSTDASSTDANIIDANITDAMMDGSNTGRMYRCGYAAPDNNCEKQRRSQTLVTMDMTAAIAACKDQKPKPKLDLCYVKDDDGPAATDESQCMAASGTWRPDRNCCNFLGTLSCSD